MVELTDASFAILRSGVSTGSEPPLPSDAGIIATKSERSELHSIYFHRLKRLHKAAGNEPSKGELLGEVNAAVSRRLRELGSPRAWFPTTPRKGNGAARREHMSASAAKKRAPTKRAAKTQAAKPRLSRNHKGIRAGFPRVRSRRAHAARATQGLDEVEAAPSGAGELDPINGDGRVVESEEEQDDDDTLDWGSLTQAAANA